MINAKSILVDGKRIGDVLEFHLSYTENENGRKATVKYLSKGKERVLTCELEAISFES